MFGPHRTWGGKITPTQNSWGQEISDTTLFVDTICSEAETRQPGKLPDTPIVSTSV